MRLLHAVLIVFFLQLGRNYALHISTKTLDLFVDASTGAFSISVEQSTRGWLQGSTYAVHAGGAWHSSTDGSLKLLNVSQGTGSSPAFGASSFIKLEWATSGNNDSDGAADFVTTFEVYPSVEAIEFTQSFPTGLLDTAVGDNSQVISVFPGFGSQIGLLPTLATFTFSGLWDLGTYATGLDSYVAGIDGGVPLVVYKDIPSLPAVVLSPSSNFKVGLHSVKTFDNVLACGLNGLVKEVPAGFTHSTLLHANSGIRNSFLSWGSLLLKKSGKGTAGLRRDVSSSTLGYWTDNGAYYYYVTEPGKSPQQTMLDVKAYLDDSHIPAKYFQFDSWWYYKGSEHGVAKWAPRPDVFPEGLTKLSNQLKSPLVLHNRYWAPDNLYNDTLYPFAKEGPKYALPLSQAFWDMLMEEARSWNTVIYEQDWLVDQYANMAITQDNVYVSHQWLRNMSRAASKSGLRIQYCMPRPMDYLESTLHTAVTQIRASNDYGPGIRHQWMIGATSLWAWSLGLIPFKDNFWTSSVEPGNPYNSLEPNPALQSLVATLSAGPVGISDKVHLVNRTLVMRTCAQDGTLLQPDRPAFAIDRTWVHSERPAQSSEYVYTTYSDLNEAAGVRTFYMFAANLSEPFDLYWSDVNTTGRMSRAVAYDYAKPNSLLMFSNSSAVTFSNVRTSVQASEVYPFQLIVAATVADNGWAFLGETDKYVSTSEARVSGFTLTETGFHAQLSGSEGESIEVTSAYLNGDDMHVYSTKCVFAASATVIKCDSGGTVPCVCS